MEKSAEFKKVYHLVGEQTLPVFIAAIQFSNEAVHFLLTSRSKKTTDAAQRLQETLKKAGRRAELLYIGEETEAVSFPALNATIGNVLDATNRDHERAAFDLTGGTKPMSIMSLLHVQRHEEITPYYLDTRGRKLICPSDQSMSMELQKKLSLENFFNLGGMELKSHGENYVPEEVLEYFYENAGKLQRFQQPISWCLPGGRHQKEMLPPGETQESYFQKQLKELEAVFDPAGWSENWEKFCSPKNGEEVNWGKQARFLAGEWFEDYVYMIVKKNNPGIREIFLSAELAFPGKKQPAQEFDVVYTDGYSLIILECKAGRVSPDHVYKLENLRNHFSGALGRCALVTLNPSRTGKNQQESFAERIQNSHFISAFCGRGGIYKLKDNGMTFVPGQIYE